MVDADSIERRLLRVEELVDSLEKVRERGQEEFLADESLRLETYYRLQTTIQACIDVAVHLGSEYSVRSPDDYASAFTNLARANLIDRDLAERLANAAKLRNVLVHIYLEVDDEKVFAALERLDDFRDFAATVQKLIEEGG